MVMFPLPKFFFSSKDWYGIDRHPIVCGWFQRVFEFDNRRVPLRTLLRDQDIARDPSLVVPDFKQYSIGVKNSESNTDTLLHRTRLFVFVPHIF